jgi:hypothetical protein
MTDKASNPAMLCLLEQMRDNPGAVSPYAGAGAAAWALGEIERLHAELIAERERIAVALDDEADATPCLEDERVVRDCARLVRAGFDYEEAERLAEQEDAANG